MSIRTRSLFLRIKKIFKNNRLQLEWLFAKRKIKTTQCPSDHWKAILKIALSSFQAPKRTQKSECRKYMTIITIMNVRLTKVCWRAWLIATNHQQSLNKHTLQKKNEKQNCPQHLTSFPSGIPITGDEDRDKSTFIMAGGVSRFQTVIVSVAAILLVTQGNI